MASRLVSCWLVVSLGGCSLAISGPQAHRKTLEPPVCDSGKGLVAVDSLAAIGFGVGGLAGLSESSSGGAIALVIAGLFTAAAVHGAGAADDCREAMEAYAQETNGVRLRYARKYDRARRDRDRARDDGEDREARRPRDARDARDARGAKTTTDRDARATPDADRDVDAAPAPAPAPVPAPPPRVEPPPAPPAPAPRPPPPPPSDDEWGQFWREVP